MGGGGQPTRRHFCPECGSYLYGAPDMVPGVYNFSIGTLDDLCALAPGLGPLRRRAAELRRRRVDPPQSAGRAAPLARPFPAAASA
jgi:hypothetical protein